MPFEKIIVLQKLAFFCSNFSKFRRGKRKKQHEIKDCRKKKKGGKQNLSLQKQKKNLSLQTKMTMIVLVFVAQNCTKAPNKMRRLRCYSYQKCAHATCVREIRIQKILFVNFLWSNIRSSAVSLCPPGGVKLLVFMFILIFMTKRTW